MGKETSVWDQKPLEVGYRNYEKIKVANKHTTTKKTQEFLFRLKLLWLSTFWNETKTRRRWSHRVERTPGGGGELSLIWQRHLWHRCDLCVWAHTLSGTWRKNKAKDGLFFSFFFWLIHRQAKRDRKKLKTVKVNCSYYWTQFGDFFPLWITAVINR